MYPEGGSALFLVERASRARAAVYERKVSVMVTSLKECQKVHAQAGRQETSRSAVLLDSEPMMLGILARFLEPVGVAAVSRQTTAAGAFGAVREHCPDLLLLDVHCLDAIGSISEARELVPGLKTIVLVEPGAEAMRIAALAAGATVVISRAVSQDDLARAVRQAFEPSIDLARKAS
jgi:DNA-binding NarL/FixJ family response regulator